MGDPSLLLLGPLLLIKEQLINKQTPLRGTSQVFCLRRMTLSSRFQWDLLRLQPHTMRWDSHLFLPSVFQKRQHISFSKYSFLAVYHIIIWKHKVTLHKHFAFLKISALPLRATLLHFTQWCNKSRACMNHAILWSILPTTIGWTHRAFSSVPLGSDCTLISQRECQCDSWIAVPL